MSIDKWEYLGQKRPPFAAEPAVGQESVWDYPRPPLAKASQRLVVVSAGRMILAQSARTIRVMETAGPPVFYIPEDDVNRELLLAAQGSSVCEWKGIAQYWALASDSKQEPVAWSYEKPLPEFTLLRGAFSFYPGRVDCSVDGERVWPQPGRFYGGWITDDVSGPFKGEPGTEHW